MIYNKQIKYYIGNIIITADFETNPPPVSKIPVYLFCISIFYPRSKKWENIYGFSIKEFCEKVEKLARRFRRNNKSKTPIKIWFHNGSKFDAKFVRNYLINEKKVPQYFSKNERNMLDMPGKKSPFKEERVAELKKLKKKPYPHVSYIITDSKKILSLTWQIDKDICVVFQDSLLFLPGSLDKLLKEQGLAIKKGEIDHTINRSYKNLEELRKDKKVYDYVTNDTIGLNLLLQNFFKGLRDNDKRFDIKQNQVGITPGQTIMNAFYRFLTYNIPYISHTKLMDEFRLRAIKRKSGYIEEKFVFKGKPKNPIGRLGTGRKLYRLSFEPEWQDKEILMQKARFERIGRNLEKYKHKFENMPLHPISPLKIQRHEFRNHFIGGLVYAKNEDLLKRKKLVSYDCKANYGSIMISKKNCPWGRPGTKLDKEYNYGFYRVELHTDFTYTSHFPFLPKNILEKGKTYPKILKEGHGMTLSQPLFDLFQKYYHPIDKKVKKPLSFSIIKSFKTIPFDKLMGDFIKHFLDKKEQLKKEGKLIEATANKIMVNSIFGKQLSKQTMESAIFTGKWDKEKESYYEIEEKTKKAKFSITLGWSIADYAKQLLVDVKIPKDLTSYVDTDCITFPQEFEEKFLKDNQHIIGNNLGQFQKEYKPVNRVLLGKKGYVLFNEDWTIKDFTIAGNEFTGKDMVILEKDYPFKLNGQKRIIHRDLSWVPIEANKISPEMFRTCSIGVKRVKFREKEFGPIPVQEIITIQKRILLA